MKILLIAALVVMVALVLLLVSKIRSSARLDPPALQAGELPPCGPKPNCVSSAAAEDSANYIAPIIITNETLASVAEYVEAIGGVIQLTDDDSIAATFTSAFFGFTDDLIVLADPDGKTLQVRSSSRMGYSDGGINRKRVEQLRVEMGSMK